MNSSPVRLGDHHPCLAQGLGRGGSRGGYDEKAEAEKFEEDAFNAKLGIPSLPQYLTGPASLLQRSGLSLRQKRLEHTLPVSPHSPFTSSLCLFVFWVSLTLGTDFYVRAETSGKEAACGQTGEKDLRWLQKLNEQTGGQARDGGRSSAAS